MQEFIEWLHKYLNSTPGTHLIELKSRVLGLEDAEVITLIKKSPSLADNNINSRLARVVLPAASEVKVVKPASKEKVITK